MPHALPTGWQHDTVLPWEGDPGKGPREGPCSQHSSTQRAMGWVPGEGDGDRVLVVLPNWELEPTAARGVMGEGGKLVN